MLVSKSLCLVSVMLQRLPAVLSRIGIILASPLVRPPIALGRGHDFARYRVSPLRITFLAVDSTRFDTGPRLRSPPKQMTFEFLLPRNTGKTVPRRCNLSFSPYFLFLSVSRSFVGDITIRKGKSGVHVQGLNRVLTNHVDPHIRTRLPDTLEYTLHTVTRALVLSCYGFERTGGTFIFL